jgi:hypothetical protein
LQPLVHIFDGKIPKLSLAQLGEKMPLGVRSVHLDGGRLASWQTVVQPIEGV